MYIWRFHILYLLFIFTVLHYHPAPTTTSDSKKDSDTKLKHYSVFEKLSWSLRPCHHRLLWRKKLSFKLKLFSPKFSIKYHVTPRFVETSYLVLKRENLNVFVWGKTVAFHFHHSLIFLALHRWQIYRQILRHPAGRESFDTLKW